MALNNPRLVRVFQYGLQGAVGYGDLAPNGLPIGGDTDYILKKSSASDFDVEWAAPDAGGIYGGSGTVPTNTMVSASNLKMTTKANSDDWYAGLRFNAAVDHSRAINDYDSAIVLYANNELGISGFQTNGEEAIAEMFAYSGVNDYTALTNASDGLAVRSYASGIGYQLNLTPTLYRITDTTSAKLGMTYGGNYTSSIINNPRSIPDVDSVKKILEVSGSALNPGGIYGGSGIVKNNTIVDVSGTLIIQKTAPLDGFTSSIQFGYSYGYDGTSAPSDGKIVLLAANNDISNGDANYTFQYINGEENSISFHAVNLVEGPNQVGSLYVNPYSIDIQYVQGSEFARLSFANGASPDVAFYDGRSPSNRKGITYGGNYTSSILQNDRSIPDVGAVKKLLQASGTVATNMLSMSASSVVFGGTITKDTTITGSYSQSLSIEGINKFNIRANRFWVRNVTNGTNWSNIDNTIFNTYITGSQWSGLTMENDEVDGDWFSFTAVGPGGLYLGSYDPVGDGDPRLFFKSAYMGSGYQAQLPAVNSSMFAFNAQKDYGGSLYFMRGKVVAVHATNSISTNFEWSTLNTGSEVVGMKLENGQLQLPLYTASGSKPISNVALLGVDSSGKVGTISAKQGIYNGSGTVPLNTLAKAQGFKIKAEDSSDSNVNSTLLFGSTVNILGEESIQSGSITIAGTNYGLYGSYFSVNSGQSTIKMAGYNHSGDSEDGYYTTFDLSYGTMGFKTGDDSDRYSEIRMLGPAFEYEASMKYADNSTSKSWINGVDSTGIVLYGYCLDEDSNAQEAFLRSSTDANGLHYIFTDNRPFVGKRKDQVGIEYAANYTASIVEHPTSLTDVQSVTYLRRHPRTLVITDASYNVTVKSELEILILYGCDEVFMDHDFEDGRIFTFVNHGELTSTIYVNSGGNIFYSGNDFSSIELPVGRSITMVCVNADNRFYLTSRVNIW